MMKPEPPPVIFTREAILQMNKSLFVLLYFGLAVVTAQSIVQEKESRIKESMKLIRLQTFSFWFTWFLTSFVFGFSPCIIFTVAFCVLTYENGPILYSDPVVIMAVLTLYSVNIISFCCMMSCFISKGRNATIVVGTMYFLLMFASPLTFQYLDTRRLAHIGGVLLFQSGIGHFLNMLMDFEKRKVSLTFDHMLSTEVLPHLNALDALVMLLTNTVLNCLIVWYMDNVYPGEYGIPQPYHFFLTTTYWCPKFGSVPDLQETPEQDVRFFEQPSDDLAPGIKIRNLLKVFNGHPAVCGITLDLYKDQITVLLGHNGAGRTTTINMITGFLPPTKGTAIVNGFDVTKNLKEARRNVGPCPQHDILFPSLTCEEHLIFYSKLREQYDRVNTKKEIDTLLEEVELTEKRKCYSAVLSGGQKRKLSVACSFIGGSQIVFLDEPSSGLDPSTRRELWNFLKKKREGRTILLTTHYMDEADILGDRIVIMAEGVVKCYGTSNFLKRIYGTGYHMNIVKLTDCDVQEITETIQRYIPEVKRTECRHYIVVAGNSRNWASTKLSIVQTKHRRNWASSKLGIVKDGHSHDWASSKLGIVKDGHSHDWASSKLGIVIDGHSHDWASSKLGIVIVGHSHDWASSKLGIVIDGHSHDWESSKLGIVIDGHSHDWASSKPSGYRANWICSNSADVSPQGTPEVEKEPELDILPEEDNDQSKLEKIQLPLENKRFRIVAVNIVLNFVFESCKDRKKKTNSESAYTEIKEGKTRANEVFDIISDFDHLTGRRLFLHQLKAIFIKKTILFTRNKLFSIVLVLVPVVLVFIGIESDIRATVVNKSKDLLFTLDRFPKDLVFPVFYLEGYKNCSFVREYAELAGQHVTVKEFELKPVGAKHLQSLSGVNPIAYWLGTFSFDIIVYVVIVALLMLAFLYNPEVYVRQDRWVLTLSVLLLYGLTMFPYLYAVQFLFRNPARAVVVMLMMAAFIGVLASFIMTMLRVEIPFEGVFYWLHLVFSLVCPKYNLTSTFFFFVSMAFEYDPEGFVITFCVRMFVTSVEFERECATLCVRMLVVNVESESECATFCARMLVANVESESECATLCVRMLVTNVEFELECATLCVRMFVTNVELETMAGPVLSDSNFTSPRAKVQTPTMKKYFEYEVHKLYFYENLVSLAVVMAISWVIVALVEYRVDRLLWSSHFYFFLLTDAIVLQDLRKQYLTRCSFFVAVHGTSICVPHNECLGLLGQNGAGKSTTFKMLTGDERISSGNAYMDGLNVKTRMKKIQTMMGYCPQQDALHDTLTGRETLYLYARLSGVPESSVEAVVQAVIDFVTLSPHDNKITQYYRQRSVRGQDWHSGQSGDVTTGESRHGIYLLQGIESVVKLVTGGSKTQRHGTSDSHNTLTGCTVARSVDRV
ncbi:hypothetical protein Btru_011535 [Bulinus truncatus]|nr:hypothetical protein Btru_011535 [Bulinus truncatus]